jgi:hypothetical protein
VRTRDLKRREGADYLYSGCLKPTAEDLRIAAQLKALHRIRKRQARQQLLALSTPDNPPPPPPGGLKRGPKPNPFRDKCEAGLHTQLTAREVRAFDVWRMAVAPHATRSVFLRWLICQGLETQRHKDSSAAPFFVDLTALDARSRRASGTARSAAQRAA